MRGDAAHIRAIATTIQAGAPGTTVEGVCYGPADQTLRIGIYCSRCLAEIAVLVMNANSFERYKETQSSAVDIARSARSAHEEGCYVG